MITGDKKRNKRKKKEKTWDSLKPPTAEPLPAKETKEKTGENREQYPPDVGYHGADDERDLNPEE